MAALTGSLMVLLAIANCHQARAQSAILADGDAAVTAFSGSKTDADIPKGLHPLDVTFIDTEGATVQVLDLSTIAGEPAGQLIDVPAKLNLKASEIGQVFGIALDSSEVSQAPNVYVAATSLFGLQIVGTKDGKTIRLSAGEAGAKWMPGQFGTGAGGGPGSIWKIDAATGKAALFANVRSGPNSNAGPGLGALAFDPVSKHLYTANLETGFVHRIDRKGAETAFFDHGTKGRARAGFAPVVYDPSKAMSIDNPNFKVEDPSTWGYTDPQRLVFALAIESGRLYYSVAHGPEVWSVGLDKEGGFLDDARLEISLNDSQSRGLITSIAFDGPEKLFISQRGPATGSYEYAQFAKPQEALVRRYARDETGKSWTQSVEEFAVGLKAPHRAANGGLALGYGYDASGAIDRKSCRATLWTTGDHLRQGASEAGVSGSEPTIVHGLQAIATDRGQAIDRIPQRSGSVALHGGGRVAVDTELDPPSQAWFADKDGKFDDAKAAGHIGAIAIYSPCSRDEDTVSRPEPLAAFAYPTYPDYSRADSSAGGGPGAGGASGSGDTGPGHDPVPWPRSSPSVSIAKSCTPAPLGGEITCTITVTNTGPVPLTEPVVISDLTTGLHADPTGPTPIAGAPLNITSLTTDGAAWTCTPVAPGAPVVNLSCGLAAADLPPGASHSVTVGIDTGSFIADGVVGFQNCASLGAPYWGEACADGGMDISIKKTVEPGCTAGNDCRFTITFSNNGSQDFSGPVQFVDVMHTLPGGASPSLVTATDIPCGLAPLLPAPLPYACIPTLNLAAGTSQSYTITVTMPSLPGTPDYWARNCAVASDPAGFGGSAAPVPDPSTGGALGTGGAVSCVWLPIGNPPPRSNLAMKKVPKIDPATGRACGKSPANPNDIRCAFTVSVENKGPSPFVGPVTFTDTVLDTTGAQLAGAQIVADAAVHNCTPSGPAPTSNHTCTPPPPAGVSHTIPSGGIIAMDMQVDVPQANLEAAGCRMRNDVALAIPASGGADNTEGSDDFDHADADAYLLAVNAGGSIAYLCDPTNLSLKKVANGDCVSSGDSYKCSYTITVTNEGVDPHTGRIDIEDALKDISATNVSFSTASPLVCRPGAWPTCTIQEGPAEKKWPTLAKGDSYAVDVTVEVPKSAAKCTVTNTAKISYPHSNTRWNLKEEDDYSEATANIPDPRCQKKAACTPSEGEFRSASGSCVCKENHARNNAGRCVRISVPEKTTSTTPQTGNEQQSGSTGVAFCPDGYPIPKSGKCPCETGDWNRQTNQCEGIAGTTAQTVTPPVDEQPLECESGWTKIAWADISAYRAKGFEVQPRDGKGQSVWCAAKEDPLQRCTPDQYQPAPGVCCLRGEGYRNGKCISSESTRCADGSLKTQNPHCCAKGTSWSDTERKCTPPDAATTSCTDKKCKCEQSGGKWNERKRRCDYNTSPPPRPTCGPDEYLAAPGVCCNVDRVYRDGKCVRQSTPPPSCDAKCQCARRNGKWNGKSCVVVTEPPVQRYNCWNGKTVTDPKLCPPRRQPCPKGWSGTFQPNCKPPVQRYNCWNGTTVTDPKLCPPRPQRCPKGWSGTFQPNCKPPVVPPPGGGGKGCKSGQYFSPQLNRCVPLI